MKRTKTRVGNARNLIIIHASVTSTGCDVSRTARTPNRSLAEAFTPPGTSGLRPHRRRHPRPLLRGQVRCGVDVKVVKFLRRWFFFNDAHHVPAAGDGDEDGERRIVQVNLVIDVTMSATFFSTSILCRCSAALCSS